MFLQVVLVLLAAQQGTTLTTFKGHKVLRIIPKDNVQLGFLNSLRDVDFWRDASHPGIPVDVRVTPEQLSLLNRSLSDAGLSYDVIVSDLQQLIDEEQQTMAKRAQISVLSKYATFGEISTWLESVSAGCSRCSIVTLGNSVEGKVIKGIKISGSSGSAKQAVFVDGGMHAREWVSPVFVTNMIQKLISDYNTDADVKAILDAYDWYLVPVLNPDGYTYTQSNNRMWRKNRARTSQRNCFGVDLNRNFGYKWGVAGVSTNPCDDTYLGTAAFSEPESRALRGFLGNLDLIVYLTFHSYGEYLLFPWGYGSVYAANHNDLKDVADYGARAIRSASGIVYTVGNSAMTLYPAAGASDDWAMAGAGAKYSYTVELSPNDYDSAGFLLPESRIPQVVSSTWPGIKAMAKRIIQKETGSAGSIFG